MADTALVDLTAETSPTSDDLLYLVNDPGGTAADRKVTVGNLLASLPGNLDVNGNKIVSASNGNIDIEPNGTGNVLLGNFVIDADATIGAGQDNYVLTYDHASGTWGPEAAAGGFSLPASDTLSVTGTDSTVALELDLTWNTTGAPKGIAIDITDTASGGGSRALSVTRNGSERAYIGVNNGNGTFWIGGQPTYAFDGVAYFGDSTNCSIRKYNSTSGTGYPGGFIVRDNGAFEINGVSNSFARTNVARLFRDDHGVFGIREQSNPCGLQIYNTVDAQEWRDGITNYERAKLRWVSNVFVIDTEEGGTGSARGIQIGAASSATIGFYGATPVAQQSTTGTTTGFTAGAGTSANDDSTYTGNTGSTAYTVGDIVRALKNLGFLAA